MIETTAQVSLRPRGQGAPWPAVDEALAIFRRHGLEVEPGAASNLISGDDEAVFAALQEGLRRAAERGPVVMTTTFSTAGPTASESEAPIVFTAIGHVENDFREARVRSEEIRAAESRIVLDPALREGLLGLQPGDRIMVVFHFHRSRGYELHQYPRGDRDRPQRGVFALRSPRRPNPIGVTVADLVSIEGNVLRVRGLDAINGTPVLDLKQA